MSIRSMALRTARRLPPRHLAQVHAKEQAQGDMLGLELAAARLPQQLRATRRALLRARRVQVRVRVPVAFELPARQCGTQTATSMCDANPSRTRVCDCACILRSVLAHASVHSSSFKRANVTQLLRNGEHFAKRNYAEQTRNARGQSTLSRQLRGYRARQRSATHTITTGSTSTIARLRA